MKKVTRFSLLLLLLVAISFLGSFTHLRFFQDSIKGAWRTQDASVETVISFVDDYFVLTSFDQSNKKFIETWGGPYTMENNKLVVQQQFNTSNKELVGTKISLTLKKSAKQLGATIAGKELLFNQMDDGKAGLAGVWRISGRKQGEQMSELPLGARRTLKVLTGTRFQWAAVNIETGEFFGTGGGSYSFENGKYTERIEFFSRDSSRVGASLSFDGKLENGQWHHSGLSSKGEPIYEVWKRIKE